MVAANAGTTPLEALPAIGDTPPAISGPSVALAVPRAAAFRRHPVAQASWATWQGRHHRRAPRGGAPLQAALLGAFIVLAAAAGIGGLRAGDALPSTLPNAISAWSQAAGRLFAPPKDPAPSEASAGDPLGEPAEFAGDPSGRRVISFSALFPYLFPKSSAFVMVEPEAADTSAAATAAAANTVLYRPSVPEIVSAAATPWLDLELQEDVERAIPRNAGTVAVAVRHVSSGASAGVNADRIMTPASTYKLGILLEAARQVEAGQLRFDEPLLLRPEDWSDGAGVLQSRIGDYVTVEDALRLMIAISDNTAALVLLRRIGSDAINQEYAELGLVRTRIFTDYQPATTTAWELSTLLTMLTSGQAAGQLATEYMLGLLALDQPQAWIANGTPGAPTSTIVAHKSGQLPGVRNDAALVYTPTGPYAIVVLTDNLWDESRGEALIETIAAAVYDHFAAWLGSVPLASR